MPRTLIADDQPDVLEALRLLLKNEGYQIETANSPTAVLESLRERDFDVLLMDLNYARDTTSGQEGLDLISRIQAIDQTLPVVVMTAWSTVPLAVEAMRRGVRDFVEKPWENRRLIETLRTEVERGQTLRQQICDREFELQEAREIGEGLLPREIPQIAGYHIAAAGRPARDLGGDYFDVIRFHHDRAAVCIADAMGKGMPAALLMSNLQAAVHSFATPEIEPRELCRKVNQVLCGNLAPGRFVTFFYGVLDGAAGRLLYTSAGHEPPILVRGNGKTIRLIEGGAVLGVFAEGAYEQGVIDLRSGDRLVLFTDGVTECRNTAGEEFGTERLLRIINESPTRDAEELRQAILSAVADFSGHHPDDDTTLIVLTVE